MTKIKNPKKGMAKKTLSISLAVAMLATSNVPVWAAEFTDGTDAAFTSEAPAEVVDEAPVVDEEEAEVAETKLAEDAFHADIKFSGVEKDNTIVWGNKISATVTVTGKDGASLPKDTTLKYIWHYDGISNGTASTLELNKATTVGTTPSEGNVSDKVTLYVFIQDNTGATVWSQTSDAITVKKNDQTDAMLENIKVDRSKPVVYNCGKDLSEQIKNSIDWGNANKDNYTVSITAGDTKNVTDAGVDVTVEDKRPGYTGKKVLNFQILPLTLTYDGSNFTGKISDCMEATLKTTEFTYTGNAVKVKASDITLVDKNTDDDLSNYLVTDENGYVTLYRDKKEVGNYKLPLNLKTPETGNRNYVIGGTTDKYIETTNLLTISARDLSTVTVKIKPQPIPAAGKTVDLKVKDITYFDAEGNELNLNPVVTCIIPDDATKAGKYNVTFKPYNNNKNVKNSVVAELVLVVDDISDATFTGKEVTTAEEYTGEAITKTAEQLGSLQRADGNPIDEKAYSIEYKNNVNAGDAKLIVVGKGNYEGSYAEFTFKINPAEVTNDTIKSETKVEVKDTQSAADYADEMDIVVKAKNAATPAKEFTLVKDVDYTVKYSYVDSENKGVGGQIKADITITNKNFIKNGKKEFSVIADIIRKSVKSEYIKLKQNDFTYTGSAIEPEFDIVVDGRIISPDEYTASFSKNINAGTATLTVTGSKNSTKFNSDKSASIDFEIKPAKAEDLVGLITSRTYTGYSIEINPDDINLKLGDNTIKVKDNFKLSFGENLNIGKGTVTLTPINGNFTGTKTVEFDIVGELINGGTLTAYDENGIKITNPSFHYDGTAHTFAKLNFTYDAKKLVEGKDYEFVYADNVYGKKVDDKQTGYVFVVAKGIYGGDLNNFLHGIVDGVYTDAEGNKIKNIVAALAFDIVQETVNVSSMTVSNGTYAGGLPVKPVVDITVKGVKLVEGKDYDLKNLTGELVNATVGKPNKVDVVFKNGYKAGNPDNFTNIEWGIDKFDLANADVTVKDGKVVVKCGKVDVDTSEYTTSVNDANGTTTITAVKDSKNYTGSKTVNTNGQTDAEKPEKPMITDVKVTGNKATVVLSGESDGATGYDYVISKDKDCITNKDYAAVNKNRLTTTTDFTYVDQGTYYAYCHSWKRVNGVKVFSDWSNAYPFVVSAITPSQPTITSVKVKGSTVTVTYTKSSNADGYDVVLGSKLATVAGERRPVEYGTLVKKNIKGNTVTATFKNVKKGTYYAGLHAFNRTSEDGKKVFSPWSYAKKVTVK